MFAPAAPAAAGLAEPAILTLLEGEAIVVDGAQRLAAVAGQRLKPTAIVESDAAATLVRIEWPDQTTVDLGPATRAMISPPGFPARSGRQPVLYLLQGWAKLSSPAKQPAGSVLTPAIEVLPFVGAAVIVADPRERFAFAESGSFEVLERGGKQRRSVATGALYAGSAGVLQRPSSQWLARVPRAFRDPIPLRAAAFKSKPVSASALPEPSYVDLADWLTAEPALRRDFPHRFVALAHDAESRRALESHLSQHPEWTPVLYPPPPIEGTR